MGTHLPGVRCSRAMIDGELTIRQGQREWSSKLLDVSLSGVKARLPEAYDGVMNDGAELEIQSLQGERVTAWARLARLSDAHAAFRFDGLSAPNEIRLRELIKRGRLYDRFD